MMRTAMSYLLPSLFAVGLSAAGLAQNPTPPAPPVTTGATGEAAGAPAPEGQKPTTPPEDRPEFAFTNASGEQPYVEISGVLARDPRTGDLGVILLSSAPGCGVFALAGDAKIGVAATGGLVDPSVAASALRLLGAHGAPTPAIEALREEVGGNTLDRHLVVLLGADGQSGVHRGHAVLGGDQATNVRLAPDWIAFGVMTGQTNTLDGLETAAQTTAGLPLPERLIAAAQAVLDGAAMHNNGYPRILNSRTVSAALLVVRTDGGRLGRGDRLVDLRVDFDADPLDRLRGLYHVWTRASLAPTLRVLQRNSELGSIGAQTDLEWLRRIRAGKKPGEK